MTTYTLKLVSGVNYNLYNGATLVSDVDLATLFGSTGSAFFVFDFDGGTPTNTTSLTIVDSNSQAVITNTGLSGIAENTNFNGDWSASATAFDAFVKSPAAVLDEAQLSDLMGKIKSAKEIKELSITADIKAKDLFGDNNTVKDGDIYFVKNTTSSSRKISFTNNASDTDITHYVMLGARASVLFIFEQSGSNSLVFTAISSKGGFGGTGYNSAQYVNAIIKSGLWDPSFGYIANPQIAGLQLAAVDNLTTTATMNPLSANQGKVLADRIGDLTTLTTTDKTSAVAAINEVNAKGVYSTTEQVVGTWIDGKPIYRRVFTDTLDANAQTWKDTNFATAGTISTVTKIEGRWGNYSLPYTRVDQANYSDREFIMVNANASTGNYSTKWYHPNNLFSNNSFTLILEYTKTADT